MKYVQSVLIFDMNTINTFMFIYSSKSSMKPTMVIQGMLCVMWYPTETMEVGWLLSSHLNQQWQALGEWPLGHDGKLGQPVCTQ